MKTIRIRQPWAWAILHAGKDIENRTWNTHYRGELLIHASGAPDRKHQGWPKRIRLPDLLDLPRGAIVGIVELVDVVEKIRSKWFSGPYGLVLTNPRPLSKPIPCKGALKLWEAPPEVWRAIRRQLRAA